MKIIELNNRFEIYKRLLKTIFKIANEINTDIEHNGRLEILIPGLNQLGIMYTSLLKLIPNEEGNLDMTSLCSISRSILDFTNTIHFYALAEISSDEIQFRIDLYNYLSFSERIINAKQLGATPKKLNNYDLSNNTLIKHREKLIKNEFFNKLKEQEKIKEDNIKNSEYINRKNLQKDRKIQIHVYDNFYSLYSTFVHSSPLAIDIFKEFLINQDKLSKKQYDYVIVVIEMSAGFISVLLKETKRYTKDWSKFLEKVEIETIYQFANDLYKY